jgi:hypothetical protein
VCGSKIQWFNSQKKFPLLARSFGGLDSENLELKLFGFGVKNIILQECGKKSFAYVNKLLVG